MSDVFISYSSADRARVKPLVDALEQLGWSVWWDRSVLPGETWDQVIQAALTDARCIIVLWSRHSIQSDWVWIEADEARRRGILVPASLDDVEIPFAFRRIQVANLVNWQGASSTSQFDELARAVTAVLSRATSAAPERTVRVEAASAQGNENRASVFTEGRRAAPGSGENRGSRRNRESRANPRLTLVLIGAFLFICLAGLAWYFVVSHRRENASGNLKQELRRTPPSPAPTSSVSSEAAPENTTQRLQPTQSPPAPASSVPPQARKNSMDELVYVWIPPGKFTMGCSSGDRLCDPGEKPAHEVTITHGFWLGETEVTDVAYERFAKATGQKRYGASANPDLPVVNVNWYEANKYCEWAGMRLPTEAEWEYAARANVIGPRYGNPDAIAWYRANSAGKTHLVRRKQPNAWGLYDMLGNAWEWVADWYSDEYSQQQADIDPVGPPSGEYRVMRGGCWANGLWGVRFSVRNHNDPTSRDNGFGFRCAGGVH